MWKRNSRCLAIAFVLLNLILSAQAQSSGSIEVDYPKSVEINEEFYFEISLNNFTDGDYDVKIDILQNGERIAKIFDDSKNAFKSTYYFVNDGIKSGENSNKFKLKIESSKDDSAEIIIKIRNSAEKTETFENYTINIQPVSEQEEKTKNNEINDSGEEEQEDNNANENIKGNKQINISNELPDIYNINNTNISEEVIYLSPPEPQNINKDSEIIFRSKNAKTAYYSIYGFALFCILLMILLIIDKR